MKRLFRIVINWSFILFMPIWVWGPLWVWWLTDKSWGEERRGNKYIIGSWND